MTDSPKQPTGRIVRMETTKGLIRFGLYEAEAPITTGNFAGLVERGFYNGLTFHRVEPGFCAQGGDPEGTGMGGSEKRIPLEIDPALKHDAAGVVAMARSADPNSARSQFYFTLGPAAFLDGGYAVFGRVIEGLDVVQDLRIGDAMLVVTLEGSAGTAPAAPKKQRQAGLMQALTATEPEAATETADVPPEGEPAAAADPEAAESGADPE
jgi:peptidyl-prolyl cis-trans isomerase B (cyclophilin B)